MNLHKFIDELLENGSSNFNLCTGVMGGYSSQSFSSVMSKIILDRQSMNELLLHFIIENGYELSLPENSISGFYVDNLLVLGISV
jgi:hypothetical protein